jgi:isochorismate hydrolase
MNFELYGQPCNISLIRKLNPHAKQLLPDCLELFLAKPPEREVLIRQGPGVRESVQLTLSMKTYHRLEILKNMYSTTRSVIIITALIHFHHLAMKNMLLRQKALLQNKSSVLIRVKKFIRVNKHMSLKEWCDNQNVPIVTLYSNIKKLNQGRAVFDLQLNAEIHAVLSEIIQQ